MLPSLHCHLKDSNVITCYLIVEMRVTSVSLIFPVNASLKLCWFALEKEVFLLPRKLNLLWLVSFLFVHKVCWVLNVDWLSSLFKFELLVFKIFNVSLKLFLFQYSVVTILLFFELVKKSLSWPRIVVLLWEELIASEKSNYILKMLVIYMNDIFM